MKDIIQFELADGTPVYVESDEADNADGLRRVGRGEREVEKTGKKFNEIIENIRPAAETVLNAFKEMNTPDEIGLDFGVKFSAKAGAVFASAAGEATIKVSLKWKRE